MNSSICPSHHSHYDIAHIFSITLNQFKALIQNGLILYMFLIAQMLYTGLLLCVTSLLTLVSLHRMLAASRLASYWAAVVWVWHWPVRCVSKGCPRPRTERSSSSKVSEPLAQQQSSLNQSLWESLDKNSLKGIQSVVFSGCFRASLCEEAVLESLC